MRRLLGVSLCVVWASVFASAAEPPAQGTWLVEFANGATEACLVRADGTTAVYEYGRSARGKPTVRGDSVAIDFDDDRVERWTPVGGRFVVEHWFPASGFPTATPMLGVAEFVGPNDGRGGAFAGVLQLGGRPRFGDRRELLSVSFEGSGFPGDPYLVNLQPLKDLPFLRLIDTKIDGSGFGELKGLENLTRLEYTGRLSDPGLTGLGALTRLRRLDLRTTGHAVDAVPERLKGLTELRHLTLVGCGLTDAGVGHLKGLTRLEHLDLSETGIGDAGLEHLNGLAGLRVLIVRKTDITEAGVRKLRQHLPKCEVTRSPRD